MSVSQLTLKRFTSQLRTIAERAWGLMIHKPVGFAILLLLTIAAFMIAVAGNLAQNAIAEGLMGRGLSWGSLIILLAIVASSFVFGSLAWVLRESFSTISAETSFSAAGPREVLILFVSHQRRLNGNILSEGPLNIGEMTIQRSDLKQDANVLDSLKPPFSWEMLLRGIEPHHRAGTLKRIYLIGSAPGTREDDKGTHVILPVCQAFLNPYVPGVPVIPWAGQCDFEMMEEVKTELQSLIDFDKQEHGSHDGAICIDITGGQKPSSAAAVLTSINRKVTIQYVQTLPPKEAHRYDISFRTAPDRLIEGPLPHS